MRPYRYFWQYDDNQKQWTIFFASLFASAILAALGSLAAMLFTTSFIAVGMTAAVIFGVGLIASFRAVFPRHHDIVFFHYNHSCAVNAIAHAFNAATLIDIAYQTAGIRS